MNTSTSEATASFSLPGLGGRALRVFRDGRTVKPLGDLVADKLPGLGVAVYVVPPPRLVTIRRTAGATVPR